MPSLKLKDRDYVAPVLTTPPPSLAPTGPAGKVLFIPYKDISISLNWNTYVISSAVTGTLTPLTQVLPTGLKAVTWAFATGECGAESWAGITPAQVAANQAAWVQAGVQYIVSTGGANGAFTCGSDAGFSAFLATYTSSSLLGVDFDIEAGQSQADIANLVQRVKVAQAAHPGLRFSFTLATLGGTQGGDQLGSTGKLVMAAIKAAGLNWSNVFINLMASEWGRMRLGVPAGLVG